MRLVVVVLLIAAHGIILYCFSSHVALSVAVVSSAIVLLVIKHLGLLGSAYAALQRARRNARRDG
jgi:hypothetical protein